MNVRCLKLNTPGDKCLFTVKLYKISIHFFLTLNANEECNVLCYSWKYDLKAALSLSLSLHFNFERS